MDCPSNHLKDSEEILRVSECVACRRIVAHVDVLAGKHKEYLNKDRLLMQG